MGALKTSWLVSMLPRLKVCLYASGDELGSLFGCLMHLLVFCTYCYPALKRTLGCFAMVNSVVVLPTKAVRYGSCIAS